jgi:UrcA family protein
MLTVCRTTIAVLGFALAIPVHAADAGTETVIVRVARPIDNSPAGMRRLERRIAVAALEACGASASSLSEVKDAGLRSACWQQSYADAIAQVGSPAKAHVAAIERPR